MMTGKTDRNISQYKNSLRLSPVLICIRGEFDEFITSMENAQTDSIVLISSTE